LTLKTFDFVRTFLLSQRRCYYRREE